MAKWADYRTAFSIEYHDLPDQVGPNVVVIERDGEAADEAPSGGRERAS